MRRQVPVDWLDLEMPFETHLDEVAILPRSPDGKGGLCSTVIPRRRYSSSPLNPLNNHDAIPQRDVSHTQPQDPLERYAGRAAQASGDLGWSPRRRRGMSLSQRRARGVRDVVISDGHGAYSPRSVVRHGAYEWPTRSAKLLPATYSSLLNDVSDQGLMAGIGGAEPRRG